MKMENQLIALNRKITLANGFFRTCGILYPSWSWANQQVDFDYLYNHAGRRAASMAVTSISDNDSVLTQAELEQLASVFYTLHHNTLDKLYQVYQYDYDPISNYDMTENETYTDESTLRRTTSGTNSHTINETDTLTAGISETVTEEITKDFTSETEQNETRTDNLSTVENDTRVITTSDDSSTNRVVTDISYNSNIANSRYGFNSVTAVPADNSLETKTSEQSDNTITDRDMSETHSGSITTLDTGTVGTVTTDEKTDNETVSTERVTARDGDDITRRVGTNADTTSGSENETGGKEFERELTRRGNIGVTTSQQMIESEIKLWQWNFIKNVVYPLADELLTIPMYI